jgi:fructokinase
MLRKLGKQCAFIGKVGKDGFGEMLTNTVIEAGIDTRALKHDTEVHTTLAIVQTLPGGDRDFSFYRKPGADINLTADELDADLIADCKIFHFGSLSLTDEPCRSATYKALELAKAAGALISYDPNLREPLWPSLDVAKEYISWGMTQCDILKISDNEIEFMTGETDFDKGAAILKERFPNIRLLNVTAGGDGSHSYYAGKTVFVDACKLGGVIETTGAGDTFCASVLNFVLEHGLEGLSEADLTAMLRFANTAAYIVTTKKGAIRSMPEREQVLELLKRI